MVFQTDPLALLFTWHKINVRFQNYILHFINHGFLFLYYIIDNIPNFLSKNILTHTVV